MEEQTPTLRIFCGYAHEDQALFRQLKAALAVLIRQEGYLIMRGVRIWALVDCGKIVHLRGPKHQARLVYFSRRSPTTV